MIVEYSKYFVDSLLTPYVSDVDFTSVYPTVMRGANISRDTFASAIYFAGRDENSEVNIPDLFSRSLNTRENTVSICSEFLQLPGYAEFEELLNKEFMENG